MSIWKFKSDYEINKDQDVDYYLIHQVDKIIVDQIVK